MISKDKQAVAMFGLDNKVNGPSQLTPDELSFMKDQMQLGTYNFINDAVALPGAANRPLIYQDPRFAMLTQFNGYMATMQATILPKMWGDYIKRGSPTMKYQTFVMMAQMITLGFASQWLKDWAKYGEPSPHLSNAGRARRAVSGSGLLGTSERALNMVFPLYDGPSQENVFMKGLNAVTGEAPSLSPVKRMANASNALYEGNTTDAKYHAARGLPVLGPFPNLANFLSGREPNK